MVHGVLCPRDHHFRAWGGCYLLFLDPKHVPYPGTLDDLAGDSLGEPPMPFQPRELHATIVAFVPRDPTPVLPGAKSLEVPQDPALDKQAHVQRQDDLSTLPTIPDPRTLVDTTPVLQDPALDEPAHEQREDDLSTLSTIPGPRMLIATVPFFPPKDPTPAPVVSRDLHVWAWVDRFGACCLRDHHFLEWVKQMTNMIDERPAPAQDHGFAENWTASPMWYTAPPPLEQVVPPQRRKCANPLYGVKSNQHSEGNFFLALDWDDAVSLKHILDHHGVVLNITHQYPSDGMSRPRSGKAKHVRTPHQHTAPTPPKQRDPDLLEMDDQGDPVED